MKEERMTFKENIIKIKSDMKNWVMSHKKGLIKGGIISGVALVITGGITAVVNRCGLSSGDESYEFVEYRLESDDYPEECEDLEETEES